MAAERSPIIMTGHRFVSERDWHPHTDNHSRGQWSQKVTGYYRYLVEVAQVKFRKSINENHSAVFDQPKQTRSLMGIESSTSALQDTLPSLGQILPFIALQEAD